MRAVSHPRRSSKYHDQTPMPLSIAAAHFLWPIIKKHSKHIIARRLKCFPNAFNWTLRKNTSSHVTTRSNVEQCTLQQHQPIACVMFVSSIMLLLNHEKCCAYATRFAFHIFLFELVLCSLTCRERNLCSFDDLITCSSAAKTNSEASFLIRPIWSCKLLLTCRIYDFKLLFYRSSGSSREFICSTWNLIMYEPPEWTKDVVKFKLMNLTRYKKIFGNHHQLCVQFLSLRSRFSLLRILHVSRAKIYAMKRFRFV